MKRGDRDEVPIGTCVVVYGELLAVAGNRTRTDCDPTAHAEIVALREAAQKFGNYRLTEAVIYSTVETVRDVRRGADSSARQRFGLWRQPMKRRAPSNPISYLRRRTTQSSRGDSQRNSGS